MGKTCDTFCRALGIITRQLKRLKRNKSILHISLIIMTIINIYTQQAPENLVQSNFFLFNLQILIFIAF